MSGDEPKVLTCLGKLLYGPEPDPPEVEESGEGEEE